jgi:hypothetical protein
MPKSKAGAFTLHKVTYFSSFFLLFFVVGFWVEWADKDGNPMPDK